MRETNVCFKCGRKGTNKKRVKFKSYNSYFCDHCRIRFVNLEPETKKEDGVRMIMRRYPSKQVHYVNMKVVREMERIWNKLEWVLVKCPKCGWKQKSQSMTTVTCFGCGKTYKVFTKKERRIVSCPEGKTNLVHQLYSLNNSGKYLR